MDQTVNIPLLSWCVTRRRRSDTAAPDGKGGFKRKGYEGGRQAHLPSRSAKSTRRPSGQRDSAGNHAPEKTR